METGNPIIIRANDKEKDTFEKVQIGAGSEYDEKWLQDKIFNDIELLSITDPNLETIKIIPLCREFSMHDSLRNVFLDILAITEKGKLILVECKLWKNPQARREVIAQIIEYASLMQSLSYSDLITKLKKYINSGDEDPIQFQFNKHGIAYDESILIDRISNSLKDGKFQLIIAGDGIRADVINLLNSNNLSGILADLCLLQVGIYKNAAGDTMMLPTVPAKTVSQTKTVLVSTDGTPAIISESDHEQSETFTLQPMEEATKNSNTEFWQGVINDLTFDHPDQEPARRGGTNTIRVPMPSPFKWVTAWRDREHKGGIFLRMEINPLSRAVNQFFKEHLEVLRAEVHREIQISYNEDQKGWEKAFFISFRSSDQKGTTDITLESQKDWYITYLNKFVTSLHPLIRKFNQDQDRNSKD